MIKAVAAIAAGIILGASAALVGIAVITLVALA